MYEFTPPKLDVKEYNALLLAEEILTDKNSFFHEHEIKRAFAKIKVAQGKMDKSELVDNQQNIFTSAYMDISPEVKKHLSSIRKAIFDKKRISITYRSPTRNHTTIRKIDPYNLIYRNSSWYVIGHCHLRDKIRIFKLMRIKEMEVLDRSYHIPSDFSIKIICAIL